MQIHEHSTLLDELSNMENCKGEKGRNSIGSQKEHRPRAQSRQRQQECIINNAQSMALQY
jgi:hypothetical protein